MGEMMCPECGTRRVAVSLGWCFSCLNDHYDKHHKDDADDTAPVASEPAAVDLQAAADDKIKAWRVGWYLDQDTGNVMYNGTEIVQAADETDAAEITRNCVYARHQGFAREHIIISSTIPIDTELQAAADEGYTLVDGLQAEIAALKAERDKALTLKRIFEHDAEIHEAQYLLERENSKRLASALMRSAPEAWNAIKDTLNQSNNELDKVNCEVQKRFNRLVKVEAERDALAAALVLWPNGMTEIEELAWDSQGEWASVESTYAPVWTHGYKRILDEINDVKAAREALAAVGKTAEGGE